ncbi:MAG: DUF302 domain-containing protein [Rubrivivax sp.]
MTTRPSLGSALLLTLLAAGAALAQPVARQAANARFEDVRDDLKAAIESRGLVVDHQSHVGAMLDRTGPDVGSTRKLYGDAQSFQFCSARVSRRMMEADPASVVLCPYSIVVYALAGQPGRVVVAYRRPMLPGASPAARAALREVDALLDGIAREAVGRR